MTARAAQTGPACDRLRNGRGPTSEPADFYAKLLHCPLEKR